MKYTTCNIKQKTNRKALCINTVVFFFKCRVTSMILVCITECVQLNFFMQNNESKLNHLTSVPLILMFMLFSSSKHHSLL